MLGALLVTSYINVPLLPHLQRKREEHSAFFLSHSWGDIGEAHL